MPPTPLLGRGRELVEIGGFLEGQGAIASGEFERAGGYFRNALGITFEASDRPNAAFCLQGLAAVAVAHGDPARAVRLLGAAEVLLESAGGPRYAMVGQDLHRRVAETTRGRLGDRAWEEAREVGRAMSFEEAVPFAFDGEDPPA